MVRHFTAWVTRLWVATWQAVATPVDYTPMIDEEFITRYEAMVGRPVKDRQVVIRVREIIAKAAGLEKEQVHPEHSIVNDLG